jgi:nucleoside-diphosphate-sugar epimerase
VRDWVHVDDLVTVLLGCVEKGIDGPLNVGTGVGTSFLELQRMVCEAAGYSPEVKVMPEMPTGVAYRVADTRALNEVWKPRVSLAEGIAEALS